MQTCKSSKGVKLNKVQRRLCSSYCVILNQNLSKEEDVEFEVQSILATLLYTYACTLFY